MKTPTLAEKLGTTARDSPLLEKARRLGLHAVELLEGLAVARGCWHYRNPDVVQPPDVSETDFSDEELAIALLSLSLPYSPHTIRLGAAMLGAEGNDPDVLARLAAAEGCVPQVRYIADAALRYESDNRFWHHLLNRLPETSSVPSGVMPHPSRFVSMTGITRSGTGPLTVWIRPRPDLALSHG